MGWNGSQTDKVSSVVMTLVFLYCNVWSSSKLWFFILWSTSYSTNPKNGQTYTETSRYTHFSNIHESQWKNLLNSICQQYCGDSFGKRVQSFPVGNNIPLMENNISKSPTVLQLTENNMSWGAHFTIKLHYMASDEAILSNPHPNIFHGFDKKDGWLRGTGKNKSLQGT